MSFIVEIGDVVFDRSLDILFYAVFAFCQKHWFVFLYMSTVGFIRFCTIAICDFIVVACFKIIVDFHTIELVTYE